MKKRMREKEKANNDCMANPPDELITDYRLREKVTRRDLKRFEGAPSESSLMSLFDFLNFPTRVNYTFC